MSFAVRPAIRTECNRRAARPPRRIAIVVDVVGEPGSSSAGNVEKKQIAEAVAADRGEDESGPVRAPVRRINRDEVVEAERVDELIRLEVEDVDDIVRAAFRHESQASIIRNADPAFHLIKRLEVVTSLAANQNFRLAGWTKLIINRHREQIRVAGLVADVQHEPRPVSPPVVGRLRAESSNAERRRSDRRRDDVIKLGEIHFANPGHPSPVDLLKWLAQCKLEDAPEIAVDPEVLDDPKDLLLAVGLGKEVHERFAVLVHQKRPAYAVDVGERDKVVGEHGIAHHHLVLMIAAAGPVFRESFGEPQWQEPLRRHPVVAQHAHEAGERKDMHQLVSDHAAELVQIPIRRNDDAPLEELEEAANTIRDEAGRDVGLFEMQVRGVKDQRDAVREGELEACLQLLIDLLGEVGAVLGQLLHLRVIVDVEMVRFEDVPVEVLVLDLVAPEVRRELCGRRNCRDN